MNKEGERVENRNTEVRKRKEHTINELGKVNRRDLCSPMGGGAWEIKLTFTRDFVNNFMKYRYFS